MTDLLTPSSSEDGTVPVGDSPLSSKDGTVLVGDSPLSIDALIRVSVQGARLRLSPSAVRKQMAPSQRHLRDALENGTPIYGVTTGYGANCGTRFVRDEAVALGAGLLRFHGCGTGPSLAPASVRAAMLCRILCFSAGLSGVSEALIDQLVAFLNHGITPVVPAQGSVGASGDLTPMSYVAAALAGERQVVYRGETMPAIRALELAGVAPYRYGPKEPLSMINGTPVMTGVAVLVVDACRRIVRAATWATAMAMHAMLAHPHHLDPVLFAAKPFIGQAKVAEALRALLVASASATATECEAPEALQDPYSLRCAPHVVGVLADALLWAERWVEIEANGVSDNPLFHPESGRPLMGGNFYGGHIAFAMDALKTAVASVADLCDRQMALLVDARFNRGLPHALAGGTPGLPRHGFKGMQITASALTAEALQATMPVSSFSRSTESHNQDKVSMGTIAARDALRVCELTEKVITIALMAATQACELRGNLSARPRLERLAAEVRHYTPAVVEDRPLDGELLALADTIAFGDLAAFEPESASEVG